MKLALALLLLGAAPAAAQVQDVRPADPVRLARDAADSILVSGDGVGLEGFRNDSITGVYLTGTLRGEDESVAYGIDAESRRYVWFSVGATDSLDLVALLLDADLDVTPDFLLFRTVDKAAREERIVEFRAASVKDAAIDIAVQPACAPPRCDPATWVVHARERVEVPDAFFAPWRAIFALAATRGEAWLGKSRALLGGPPPT